MRLTLFAKRSSKSKKVTLQKLRKFNLVAALAMIAQGVAVLVLSNAERGAQPINVDYLAKDTLLSDSAGQTVFASATRHLVDINLAYVVAAFFFLGAGLHLLAATRYQRRYETGLRRGINPVRWWQYTWVVGTMLLAIALVSGVFDYSVLALIFGLNIVVGVSWLLMEKSNQGTKTPNWSFYKLGLFAWLLAWLPIVVHIKGAIVYGDGLPTYVYYVCGSLFVLLGGFLVNTYLQFKKRGSWSSYLYSEQAFIALTLVATAALGWQIFAGVLR